MRVRAHLKLSSEVMTLGSMPAGEDAGLRFGILVPILNFLPPAHTLRVLAKPRFNTRAYKGFFRFLPHEPEILNMPRRVPQNETPPGRDWPAGQESP